MCQKKWSSGLGQGKRIVLTDHVAVDLGIIWV